MPRLHHLADANPFDFYDCFALDKQSGHDLRKAGRIHLFGNANISLNDRTNTHVPGTLSSDQTAMIQNVYARTNIVSVPAGFGPKDTAPMLELVSAFKQFIDATQVTLVVGDKPQRQWPLSVLLGRTHGERNADDIPIGEADEYFEDIAKVLYEAYREAGGTGHTWDSLPDKAGLGISGENGKTPWRSAARATHRHLKSPQLVIIPPRQHHSVLVTVEERSLGKLLELVPPGIAPAPLVWIHLEGFSRRDVC